MKAKYKKSIILASSALSLMIGAAIVLSSNENLFSIMMRAANQSVTGGNVSFARDATDSNYTSSNVGSVYTYTTSGFTVRGQKLYAYAANNITMAVSSKPMAIFGSTDASLKFTTNQSGTDEFEFQDINSISIGNVGGNDRTVYVSYSTNGTDFTDESLTCTAKATTTKTFSSAVKKIRLKGYNAFGFLIGSITLNYDCKPPVVKNLTSISIDSDPDTTTYYEGEAFNPTGMVVTAHYDDLSTETVTDYTYSTSALTSLDTEVEISYTENGVTKTANQEIDVVALESIAVTTAPTTTTYTEGDSFDPTGMVVTATFKDEHTKDVTSDCTFSSDELSTSDTEVTITYLGESTTQAVTVEAASFDLETYLKNHGNFALSSNGASYNYVTIDFGAKVLICYYDSSKSFEGCRQTFTWSLSDTTLTVSTVTDQSSSSASARRFRANSTVSITVTNDAVTAMTVTLYSGSSGTGGYSNVFNLA